MTLNELEKGLRFTGDFRYKGKHKLHITFPWSTTAVMLLPTDAFPCPQAKTSKTFKVPPLDGSLLFHELIEYNAEQSPDHPLYVYDTVEGDVRTVTWKAAVSGFRRATQIAISSLSDLQRDPNAAPVVGILANSGDYERFVHFIHF